MRGEGRAKRDVQGKGRGKRTRKTSQEGSGPTPPSLQGRCGPLAREVWGAGPAGGRGRRRAGAQGEVKVERLEERRGALSEGTLEEHLGPAG